MNGLLLFAAIVATAFARPDGLLDGHVSVTQSTLGTYKYTIQLKDSTRSEERFADGTVLGEFTAIGSDGLPHTVKYQSGVDGFRILDGELPVLETTPLILTGLPLPVEDTPEVKAAKEQFLATYRETLALLPATA